MSRGAVERMLDALLGLPWHCWDAALSLRLDLAVIEEEATA